MSRRLQTLLFTILFLSSSVLAQTSTASISGVVIDEKESVIPNGSVTVRNTGTGFTRTIQTDAEGRYQFTNLPIGSYEVTVEAASFSKYVQTGITLEVNQNAVIDISLKPGGVQETVTVTENAAMLNTTTAEVSTRFDARRLAELPIAPSGNVYNVLLSVPGVSQLSSNQIGFTSGATSGISFSANGARLRSNNFMIDGQDINDPSVAGGSVPLNNPDAFQEVRIVTNQFLAEYGRNSGSIVNFVGKSGTNDFRGSLYWFHNNEHLNACSNLDKAAGFCNQLATDPARKRAPRRLENRIGFTFGGPVTFLNFGEGVPLVRSGKDKTFFFVDYQRWADRALGSGFTINGAPTAEGRALLQQCAGNRPQVQALLRFLPAGTPNGQSRIVTINNGPTFTVPLGNFTGSSDFKFDDHQGAFRIDHRINANNLLYGRYRFSDQLTTGQGQVTPPGLTTVVKAKTKAATLVWNSVISSRISNEGRLAWTRYDSSSTPVDPSSETIPSIEINDLGLTQFNSSASRTALGLAINSPQFRANDTYQISDSLSYIAGNHSLKFGVDGRRIDVRSFFFPTVRGRLAYTSLSNFVNDVAQTATINLPLRGGDIVGFYRWYEFYAFAQDEWKIRPDLTLTLGLRYEYPGDSFGYLKNLNERILAANGNNPAFRFEPEPKVDKDNLMPRIGFNWNPRTSGKGVLDLITGGDKLAIRGGYARTYDANFININLNVFSSFPFVAAQDIPASQPAFTTLQSLIGTAPNVSNPGQLVRTVVSEDFRAPAYDQFLLEFQRELTNDMVLKVGYIRTRGTGLLQTLDGNPRQSCPWGVGAGFCNTTGINPFTGTAAPTVVAPRVDPTRGAIRLRANSASSTYDSLQVSFDKRLSRGFSAGFHYTWSTFIDEASEIFNPSGAEIAIPQDSFNRRADRARSSYDRPHRFTGNFVYELPFYQNQEGVLGKIFGGWQVNSFFTLQSGAPFTPLNGVDPAGALSGIDALVGNAIRPNVYTNLDVSRMTTAELFQINQQLRNQALQQAQQIFNSLPPVSATNPCVAGLLPGQALSNTLFTSPVGRITCSTVNNQVVRGLVVDFNGLLPGQRVGNAGRNILRSDGIRNIDFGIIKNTRISENVRVQFRVDMFNAFNSRNFGIPPGNANAANFLNQWTTNGGNRRIVLGARLVF
ncbi:MAG: carboxypeptidase regulatory-like domain-containing protein [Acidobacteriota bacterium]|nr:carboxypeptidase regulatory-like domain-containing protein [Acidobacteriota bacterium]